MNRAVYERNILDLAGADPQLASRLGRAETAAGAGFVLSRTGKTVMTLEAGGARRALHSLFDPQKEARRLLEAFPRDGFFLFLGFGCAYHILPCLAWPEVSQLVIVDKDIGILKAVLGEIDLRALFMDPRVRFLIDPKPEELSACMLSHYFPALAGDFHTVTLRPRVEQEKDFFRAAAELVRQSLEELSGDFSAQSHFGKKWFLNTLSNLASAQASSTLLHPKPKALVTGAGPSLEDAIPALKAARGESLLVATDASLPVLLRHDLCPDMVVSIDCQHIGYHHFMAGYPPEVPLVLDLASPPVITRLSSRQVFFTSAHPFSQYVSSHWRRFPFIDTSGGNVSHAAVFLADALGAKEIFLYGADFSYPGGKLYAREAYLYPYFRCRETRTAGIESLCAHFLFRNPGTRAVWRDGKVRYTNALMLRYKEKLEGSCARLGARLVPVPGGGERLSPAKSAGGREKTFPAIFAAGTPKGSWKSFLAGYRESLAGLPLPRAPVISHIQGLSREEKILWTTLLPVSAVFARSLRARGKPPSPSALLELSRAWTGETVERALERGEA
jgi:hypothetical protein